MKIHSVKDGNKRRFQGYTLRMLILEKILIKEQTTSMILYFG